jgi:tight adherence protein C
MPLLFALVFLATIGAVLAVRSARHGRRLRAVRLLEQVESGRQPGSSPARALGRAATELLRRLLDHVAPWARSGGEASARTLRWAGVALDADAFAALRLVLLVGGALGGLALGTLLLGWAGAVPAAILGGAVGQVAPDVWLSMAVGRRRVALDRELLYFLDLLALTAQAGLSLDAALERVAAEFPGLLSTAFAAAQRQRGLGQWSEHAFADLAEELGHPDVRLLCEALARAGRFGAGTAASLREFAASVRNRRQLAAQEQANRAGAAIVLPVAVFILPSIVLILGYPALSLVVGALGGR